MYVPRALRSQNAPGLQSSSTTGSADRTTSASEVDGLGVLLPSVAVSDSSPRTGNEPPPAAPDNQLPGTAADRILHSTRSVRDKKTGCRTNDQPKKISCQEGTKKVPKGSQKSKSALVQKRNDADKDKADVDVNSSETLAAVNSNIVTTCEDLCCESVTLSNAEDTASAAESASNCDADSSRQTLTSCTELTGTDLLNKVETNCSSDNVENTVLSVEGAEEAVKSCELVSNDAELASDVMQLTVTDTDCVCVVENERKLQQHQLNVDELVETVTEADISSDVKIAESRDTTEATTAACSSVNHSTVNTVNDDRGADGNDDNDDADADDDEDEDEDSWDKMFDDSGEMLHQSDAAQVIIQSFHNNTFHSLVK